MEYAIIMAILLVACIAWVVLGARADRRQPKGDPAPPRHVDASNTAAYGTSTVAFGGDSGGDAGGSCS
jgi:hypothetical protein